MIKRPDYFDTRKDTMLRRITAAAALSAALFSPLAHSAGADTQALTTCVTDHTNGKERKELIRWVFLAISAHPEIQDFVTVNAATKHGADAYVASLVTRLMAEDCAKELSAAYKSDGTDSIRVAFGTLGELAMRELMTNPNVSQSLNGMQKLIDNAKVAKALGQ